MDQFLNLEVANDNPNPHKILQELYFKGGWLVGSRGVFGSASLPESTDWDVMVRETPTIEDELVKMGFVKIADEKYAAEGLTKSIWEWKRGSVTLQVTVKFDKSYDALVKFWRYMFANPTLFKHYFWKSSPAFVEESVEPRSAIIAKRIEYWVNYIVPGL